MTHRIQIQKEGKTYDTLEDILPSDSLKLDMLIIGKVPAPESVKAGHYFQGRQGKTMWNKLTSYEILKKNTLYYDDSLLHSKIGITDIVKEPREYGNEPSSSEYSEGKKRIISIIDKYKPKVVFFVYKPVLEHLVSPLCEIIYGFNENLTEYFNGCKVFLFPMPGTPGATKDIIEKAMTDLKKYLKNDKSTLTT